MITTSTCECCSEETLHIPFGPEDISYDVESGFVLHLTKEEAHNLMIELREEVLMS